MRINFQVILKETIGVFTTSYTIPLWMQIPNCAKRHALFLNAHEPVHGQNETAILNWEELEYNHEFTTSAPGSHCYLLQ